jgi:Heliorhodopsin
MADDVETKLKSLKSFNLAMGVVHLFQGILMLVLSNSFTLPVTRGYHQFNPLTEHLDPVT